LTSPAVKALPPVAFAIFESVCGSGGTGDAVVDRAARGAERDRVDRDLAFLRVWAASSGSLPRTDLPSESSTMAAGALPLRLLSAAVIASPVAVLPAALTDCSASRTASWSRVGDCSTSAFWLKATAPTLTLSGIASRNVAAAFLAAASRFGRHVGGEHRAGAVGDDHHARLLGGDGDRGLRLGERDEQRGDRDAVADDRDMAPPAGAPRGDRGQQVRGRERLRAPLGAHVEDERDRDQREADQIQGAGEAHRLQRLPSRVGLPRCA
jgi:hypothetical protein